MDYTTPKFDLLGKALVEVLAVSESPMTAWELAEITGAKLGSVNRVLRGGALAYPAGTFEHSRRSRKNQYKKSFYWRLKQHTEPAPTAPPVAQRTTEDVRREMGLIK